MHEMYWLHYMAYAVIMFTEPYAGESLNQIKMAPLCWVKQLTCAGGLRRISWPCQRPPCSDHLCCADDECLIRTSTIEVIHSVWLLSAAIHPRSHLSSARWQPTARPLWPHSFGLAKTPPSRLINTRLLGWYNLCASTRQSKTGPHRCGNGRRQIQSNFSTDHTLPAIACIRQSCVRAW